MSFSEAHSAWLKGDPSSPMFIAAGTQPVPEPGQRVPIESRASVGLLLEAILEELRKMNNVPREGAASSCEIKFLAPTKDHPQGKPQPVVKAYAGSEVPVEAAIEAYGRAFLMSQQAAIEGWEQTIDVLQAERGRSAA